MLATFIGASMPSNLRTASSPAIATVRYRGSPVWFSARVVVSSLTTVGGLPGAVAGVVDCFTVLTPFAFLLASHAAIASATMCSCCDTCSALTRRAFSFMVATTISAVPASNLLTVDRPTPISSAIC